jgi:hypothetical protein
VVEYAFDHVGKDAELRHPRSGCAAQIVQGPVQVLDLVRWFSVASSRRFSLNAASSSRLPLE